VFPRILTPRIWWLREIVGAWWALAYAGVYYRPMQYITRIIVLIGINISLAVSLNIINGHAGQFSLGHVGFMAIGAYAAAYMTYYHFGPYVDSLPLSRQPLMQNALLVVAILIGGAVTAIFGYLVGLPSLRLRGDYLAIVTLGFGEIIRVLILNIEVIGAVTIIISRRLVASSVGRAFLAVREDEIAAESMGVDTTRYKVKAFVIGSALAGVAGGLFAHYTPAYLNPGMFTFMKSFEVVVMIVLGGLGSISGAVIGAIVITILPELLRYVKEIYPEMRDPRMVIYSIMLIVLMLTRPQGLLGRRELWDFLQRRKDTIPKEARDQGNADDKLDGDAA
jgi:branched-chain amino acid transport system permease protein